MSELDKELADINTCKQQLEEDSTNLKSELEDNLDQMKTLKSDYESRVSALQAEAESLATQVGEKVSLLEEASERSSQLNSSLEEVKCSLQEATDKCSDQELQLKQLTRELKVSREGSSEKGKEFEEKSRSLLDQLSALENDLESQKKLIEEQKSENSKLSSALNFKNNELDHTNNELQTVTVELQNVQKLNEEHLEHISQLNGALNIKDKELRSSHMEVNELNVKFDNVILEMKVLKDELRNVNESAESEKCAKENFQSDVSSLSLKLDESDRQLQEKEKQLKELEDDKDETVSSLQNDLESANSEKEELNSLLNAKESELSVLKENCQHLQEQLTSLSKELDVSTLKLSEFQDINSDLKKQISQYDEKLTSISQSLDEDSRQAQEVIEKLQEEKETQEVFTTSLERQLISLEAEIKAVREGSSMKDAQINLLTGHLGEEELRNDGLHSAISQHQKTQVETDEKVRTLYENNQVALQDICNLQTSFDSVQNDKHALQSSVDSLTASSHEASLHAQSVSDRCDQLTKSLSDKELECSQLSSQLTSLQSSFDDKHIQFVSETQSLQDQFEQKQSEYIACLHKHEQLDKEYDIVKADLHSLRLQLEVKDNTLKANFDKIEYLDKELNDSQSKISQLTDSLNSSRLELLDTLSKDLEAKNSSLHQQVTDLNSELSLTMKNKEECLAQLIDIKEKITYKETEWNKQQLSLQSIIDEKDNVLTSQNNSVRDFEVRMKESESTISSLRAENNDLQEKMVQQNKEIEKQLLDSESQMTLQSETSQKLHSEEEKSQMLLEDVHNLKKNLSSLSKSNEDIIAEKGELEKIVKDSEDKISELSNERFDALEQLKHLKAHLESAEKLQKEDELEKERLKNEEKLLKEKTEELLSQNNSLVTDFKSVQENLFKLEEKFQTLSIENSALLKSCDEKQYSFNQLQADLERQLAVKDSIIEVTSLKLKSIHSTLYNLPMSPRFPCKDSSITDLLPECVDMLSTNVDFICQKYTEEQALLLDKRKEIQGLIDNSAESTKVIESAHFAKCEELRAEINKLKKDIDTNSKKFIDLQSELEMSNNERNKFKSDSEAFSQELELVKTEKGIIAKDLNLNIEELNKDKEKLMQNIKFLEINAEKASSEIEDLHKKIITLSDNFESATSNCTSLKEKLENSNKTVSNMKEDNRQLHNSMETLQQKLNSFQKEMKIKIDSLQNEIVEKVNAISALEEHISGKSQIIQQFTSDLQEKDNVVAGGKQQIMSLEKTISEQNETFENQREKLDGFMQELEQKENEIKTLMISLENMTAVRDSAETNSNILQKKLNASLSANSDFDHQVSGLVELLNISTVQFQMVVEQINVAKLELDTLTVDRNERQKCIEELSEKLQMKDMEIESKQLALENLTSKLEKKSTDQSSLQNHLDEMKSQLQASLDKNNKLEMDLLVVKDENNSKQTASDQFEKQVTQLNADCSRLSVELSEEMQKLEGAILSNEEKAKVIEKLSEEIASLKENLADNFKLLEQAEAALNDTKTLLALKSQECDDLTLSMDKGNDALNKLQQKNRDIEDTLISYQHDLEKANHSLHANILALDIAQKNLDKEIAEKQSLQHELKNERDSSVVKINNLTLTLNESEALVKEKASEFSAMEAKNQDLISSIEELKSKMSEIENSKNIIERELETKDEIKCSLESQLQEIISVKESLEHNLEEEKEKIIILETEYMTFKRDAEEKLSTSDNIIIGLKNELEKALADFTSEQQELDNHKNRVAGLEEHLQKAIKEKEGIKEVENKLVASFYEKLQSWQTDENDSEQEDQYVVENVQSFQGVVDFLTSSLECKIKEKKCLKGNLKEKEETMTVMNISLNNQLAALTHEKAHIEIEKKSMSEMWEKESVKLREDFETVANEKQKCEAEKDNLIKTLIGDIEEHKSETKSVLENVKQLQEDKKQLESKFSELSDSYEEEKNTRLRLNDEKLEMIEKCARLQKEVEECQASNAELTDNLTSTSEKLKSVSNNLQDTVATMQAFVADHTAIIGVFQEDSIQQQNTEHSLLALTASSKQLLEEKKRKIITLSEELKELDKTNCQLMKDQENVEKLLADATAMFHEMSSEKAKIEKSLGDSVTELYQALDKAENENEEKNQQISSLNTNLASKVDELDLLKEELEYTKATVEDVKSLHEKSLQDEMENICTLEASLAQEKLEKKTALEHIELKEEEHEGLQTKYQNTILELQSQVLEFEHAMTVANYDLKDKNDEIKILESKLSLLESDLEEKVTELFRMKSESTNQVHIDNEKEELISELKEMCKNQQLSLDEKTKENEEKAKELESLQTKVCQLNASISENNEELLHATTKLNILFNEAEEGREKFCSLESNYHLVGHDYSKQTAKFMSEINDLESKLISQKEEHDSDKSQLLADAKESSGLLHDKISGLGEELKCKEDRLCLMQTKYDGIYNSFNEITSELKDMCVALHESKRTRIDSEKRIAVLESKHKEKLHHIDELSKQLRASHQHVETVQSELGESISEITRKGVVIRDLENEIENVVKARDVAEFELKKIEEQRQALQLTVDILKEEKQNNDQTLSHNLEHINKALFEERTKSGRLQKGLREMKNNIQKWTKEKQQMEENFKKKTENLNQALSEKKTELNELNNALQECKTLFDVMKKEFSADREILNNVQKAEVQIKEKKDEFIVLSSNFTSLKEENDSLTKIMASTKTDLLNISASCKFFHDTLTHLQQSLKVEIEEKNKMKETIKSLMQTIDSLKSLIQSSQEELQMEQKNLKKMVVELKGTCHAQKKLQEEVSGLQKQLEESLELIQNSNEKIQQQEFERNHLSSQLEVLASNLDQATSERDKFAKNDENLRRDFIVVQEKVDILNDSLSKTTEEYNFLKQVSQFTKKECQELRATADADKEALDTALSQMKEQMEVIEAQVKKLDEQSCQIDLLCQENEVGHDCLISKEASIWKIAVTCKDKDVALKSAEDLGASLQTQILSMEEKIADIKLNFKQSQKDLELSLSENKELRNVFEQQKTDIQIKYANYEADQSKMNDKIMKLEEEKSELLSEKEIFQTNISQLQFEKESMAKFEQHFQNASAEKDILLQQLSEHNAALVQSTHSLEQEKAKCQSMNDEISSLSQIKEDLTEKLNSITFKAEETLTQKAKLEQEISVLEDTLASRLKEFQEAQNANTLLSQKLSETESYLKEISSQKEKLEENVQGLDQKVSYYQELCKDLESHQNDNESCLSDLLLENQVILAEIVDLRSIAEANAANESLTLKEKKIDKSLLSKFEGDLSSFKNQYIDMKQQIEKLNTIFDSCLIDTTLQSIKDNTDICEDNNELNENVDSNSSSLNDDNEGNSVYVPVLNKAETMLQLFKDLSLQKECLENKQTGLQRLADESIAERNALKSQLCESQVVCQNLSQEADTMSQELQKLQYSIEEKDNSTDCINEVKSAFEKDIQEVKLSMSHLEEENQKEKEEKEMMINSLQDNNERIIGLESELNHQRLVFRADKNDLLNNAKKAEAVSENLREEINVLKTNQDEKCQRFETAMRELLDKIHAYEQEKTEMETRMEECRISFESNIVDVKNSLEHKVTQHEEALKEIDALRSEMKAIQEEKLDLCEQIEKSISEAKTEMHLLNEQNSEIESQVKSLNEDLNAANSTILMLNGQLNVSNQEVGSLKQELVDANEEIENIRDQFKKSEQSVCDLENEQNDEIKSGHVDQEILRDQCSNLVNSFQPGAGFLPASFSDQLDSSSSSSFVHPITTWTSGEGVEVKENIPSMQVSFSQIQQASPPEVTEMLVVEERLSSVNSAPLEHASLAKKESKAPDEHNQIEQLQVELAQSQTTIANLNEKLVKIEKEQLELEKTLKKKEKVIQGLHLKSKRLTSKANKSKVNDSDKETLDDTRIPWVPILSEEELAKMTPEEIRFHQLNQQVQSLEIEKRTLKDLLSEKDCEIVRLQTQFYDAELYWKELGEKYEHEYESFQRKLQAQDLASGELLKAKTTLEEEFQTATSNLNSTSQMLEHTAYSAQTKDSTILELQERIDECLATIQAYQEDMNQLRLSLDEREDLIQEIRKELDTSKTTSIAMEKRLLENEERATMQISKLQSEVKESQLFPKMNMAASLEGANASQESSLILKCKELEDNLNEEIERTKTLQSDLSAKNDSINVMESVMKDMYGTQDENSSRITELSNDLSKTKMELGVVQSQMTDMKKSLKKKDAKIASLLKNANPSTPIKETFSSLKDMSLLSEADESVVEEDVISPTHSTPLKSAQGALPEFTSPAKEEVHKAEVLYLKKLMKKKDAQLASLNKKVKHLQSAEQGTLSSAASQESMMSERASSVALSRFDSRSTLYGDDKPSDLSERLRQSELARDTLEVNIRDLEVKLDTIEEENLNLRHDLEDSREEENFLARDKRALENCLFDIREIVDSQVVEQFAGEDFLYSTAESVRLMKEERAHAEKQLLGMQTWADDIQKENEKLSQELANIKDGDLEEMTKKCNEGWSHLEQTIKAKASLEEEMEQIRAKNEEMAEFENLLRDSTIAIKNLQENIESINREKSNIVEQLSALQNSHEHLVQEKYSLENHLQQIEEEKETAVKQLLTSAEQITYFENRQQASDEFIKQIQSQLECQKEENKSFQDVLKEENKTLKDKIQEQENFVQTLQVNIDSQISEIESLQQERDSAEKGLSGELGEAHLKVDDLRMLLKNKEIKFSSLQEKHNELDVLHEKLKHDLANANETNMTLQTSMRNIEAELAQYKEYSMSLQGVQTHAAQQQQLVSQLTQQCEMSKDQLVKQEELLNQVKDESRVLKEQLNNSYIKIEQVNATNEDLRAEVIEKTNQVDISKESCSRLEDELNTLLTSKAELAESQHRLQHQLYQEQQDKNFHEERHQMLSNNVAANDALVSELKEQVAILSNKAEQANSLNADILSLKQTLEIKEEMIVDQEQNLLASQQFLSSRETSAKAEVESMQEQIMWLKSQLEASDQSKDSSMALLQEKIEDLMQENQMLKSQCIDQTNKIQSKELALNESLSKIESLQHEIENNHQNIDACRAEVESLQHNLMQEEEKERNLNESLMNERAINQDLMSGYSTLQSAVSEKDSQLAFLTEKVEALNKELSSVTNALEFSDQILTQEKESHADLNRHHEELQAAQNVLKNENIDLKQELDKIAAAAASSSSSSSSDSVPLLSQSDSSLESRKISEHSERAAIQQKVLKKKDAKIASLSKKLQMAEDQIKQLNERSNEYQQQNYPVQSFDTIVPQTAVSVQAVPFPSHVGEGEVVEHFEQQNYGQMETSIPFGAGTIQATATRDQSEVLQLKNVRISIVPSIPDCNYYYNYNSNSYTYIYVII